MKSLALVVLTLLLLVSAPCRAQYAFTSVDYPGAAITRLVGLNDHRESVGNFAMAGQVRHAFRYAEGAFEALDPTGILGTHESAANQINNRGDITGWYTGDDKRRHGYVLIDGVVNTVDYPAATFTQVNGVSDTGVIFGHFKDAAAVVHGFILEDGQFTQVDFPGAIATYPYYINARGDLAGNYLSTSGTVGHGFVRPKNGNWIGFDVPGAPEDSTVAIGINDRRQILGYYQGNSGPRPFLVSLDQVGSPDGFRYVDFDKGTVWPETMNNAGTFVGIYSDSTGTHGFIAEPTGGGRD